MDSLNQSDLIAIAKDPFLRSMIMSDSPIKRGFIDRLCAIRGSEERSCLESLLAEGGGRIASQLESLSQDSMMFLLRSFWDVIMATPANKAIVYSKLDVPTIGRRSIGNIRIDGVWLRSMVERNTGTGSGSSAAVILERLGKEAVAKRTPSFFRVVLEDDVLRSMWVGEGADSLTQLRTLYRQALKGITDSDDRRQFIARYRQEFQPECRATRLIARSESLSDICDAPVQQWRSIRDTDQLPLVQVTATHRVWFDSKVYPVEDIRIGGRLYSVVMDKGRPKILGKGTFGMVYVVADAKGKQYAVKKIQRYPQSTDGSLQELQLQHGLAQESMSIPLVDGGRGEDADYLVMPLGVSGLSTLETGQQGAKRQASHDYLKGVSETIRQLYIERVDSERRIPTDLKPENVLFVREDSGRQRMVLCDTDPLAFLTVRDYKRGLGAVSTPGFNTLYLAGSYAMWVCRPDLQVMWTLAANTLDGIARWAEQALPADGQSLLQEQLRQVRIHFFKPNYADQTLVYLTAIRDWCGSNREPKLAALFSLILQSMYHCYNSFPVSQRNIIPSTTSSLVSEEPITGPDQFCETLDRILQRYPVDKPRSGKYRTILRRIFRRRKQ